MDYVLCFYALTACAAVWYFVWSLGGPTARVVITLGAYRLHPGYAPYGRLQRGHADHRSRSVTVNAFGDLLVPEMVVDPTRVPVLVRASMAADGSDTGAEHWGELLGEMNTEEREIYNLEMVELHEEAMQVQRGSFGSLDRLLFDFEERLDEVCDRRVRELHARLDGLLVAHGPADRWGTGQFDLVTVGAHRSGD